MAPEFQTPDAITIRATRKQTRNELIKTPIIDIIESATGFLLPLAPKNNAAVPRPASLELSVRDKPHLIACCNVKPIVPPAKAV